MAPPENDTTGVAGKAKPADRERRQGNNKSKPTPPTRWHNDEPNNTSKASFKLDLIETVNADPMMKPSDLALVAAHLTFMTWPDRLSWLSMSRARAATGMSERQIGYSRRRIAKRGYLKFVERRGTTSVFQIENTRTEDMRHHVALLTGNFREKQKNRQAERRRIWRVQAKIADTAPTVSHSDGDCNVPARFAGNSPRLIPLRTSTEEGLDL